MRLGGGAEIGLWLVLVIQSRFKYGAEQKKKRDPDEIKIYNKIKGSQVLKDRTRAMIDGERAEDGETRESRRG